MKLYLKSLLAPKDFINHKESAELYKEMPDLDEHEYAYEIEIIKVHSCELTINTRSADLIEWYPPMPIKDQ